MFNLKKLIHSLIIIIFALNLFSDELNTETPKIDDELESGLFYIGLGNSNEKEIIDDEPWSVGLVIRDIDSFYGFDIGGEGIMIEQSRNYNNSYTVESTEQALSFNILAGLKVTEIEKLRIDMGLLAGIIEKSSECPSSYGSYQCYYSSTYNNRADYEYTFNYGLVLHATYDRITLGVRSTGESTQVLLGINF